VQIDNWNRMAVRNLLADAGRTLALPAVETVRGNPHILWESIAKARKNYLDFVRRGSPLIMSDDEQNAFQKALDHLIARLPGQ
jgi:O-phosphoseryl-tRNA(Cys) synthetase